MDIWVNKSDSNFNQLQLAITEFRVPSVKGLDFNYTYQQSTIELVGTFGINTNNS